MLGEEWSDPKSFDQVMQDMIVPHCREKTVLEIGIGGGRVASKVASSAKALVGVDISLQMLKKCKENLSAHQNIEFLHQTGENLPITLKDRQFDFIYCFDVLVHCDIHTINRVLRQARQILAPNGMLMISVANLCSDLGFSRFLK